MAQNWLKQLQASNAQNAINAQSKHHQFDADGDGKLSANELAQACNITVQEARDIIKVYDANGDGFLDPQEFEELKQQILQQQGTDAQRKYGANELASACNLTKQEAQAIINEYLTGDPSNNGLLDYQDFEDLKSQILQQQQERANNNFAGFDANGDGKLSAIELANACMLLLQYIHIHKLCTINVPIYANNSHIQVIYQQQRHRILYINMIRMVMDIWMKMNLRI